MYIDYYYAPISGYAYLGEPRLVEIAAKWDVTIRYKPVDIVRVFAEAGTVPPPKQSKARLDYRVLDLQRNADYLQLPINPRPRFWPVPVELAARSIYAAVESGMDAHRLSFAILTAVYAQEKDVSNEEVMKALFASLALDVEPFWDRVWSESVGQAFETATQEAIALGVFGSPTYAVSTGDASSEAKTLFFGQDRLHLLDHHLAQHLA